MEIDNTMSPPPLPPAFLPDFADSCTLNSPVYTQSVACFADSSADIEFAALLKNLHELDALRVI